MEECKFTKDEALKYLKEVNRFFGFKEPVAVKEVVDTANELGGIIFSSKITAQSIRDVWGDFLNEDENLVNVLWLNAMLNNSDDLYLTFNFFGKLSSRKKTTLPYLNRAKRRVSADKEDLLNLYLFSHQSAGHSSPVTLKSKDGGRIVLDNINDWFTDMLCKYSEKKLPDIANIEQAREALIKPKGRPSADDNCIIWGTYRLLSYYGIIKDDKVTKEFLGCFCEYLGILGYASSGDSIRATISQMRSGKMKRPQYKKIEL